MIAVDTNILVYASMERSHWHVPALRCLKQLAEQETPWAIAWPSIHEFLAIVTHPKIYRPPTPVEVAIRQVESWLESPSLRLVGEGPGYWNHLSLLLSFGKVVGPRIQDARIAAICRLNGITQIWSADRDFSRFAGIVVRNPLLPRESEKR
ncbi:MAG: PIN domain-containing protein [Acidobacteria bacterium]|nr:PIN domain-containing protein [Acidobacteriota bacterium]